VSDPSRLLELDCDVLVPAALEDQITAENAPRVRARIVAEAANGPVDPEGDRILSDRGSLVLPDIYLNAGGVTVSYFEWLKNLSHASFERMTTRYEEMASARMLRAVEQLTGKSLPDEQRRGILEGPTELDLVRTALTETMEQSYQRIRATWRSHSLPDLRTAAYRFGIVNVANSYLAQGIFP
jgi:glutamate dehydrogenase (NAD(P)+)